MVEEHKEARESKEERKGSILQAGEETTQELISNQELETGALPPVTFIQVTMAEAIQHMFGGKWKNWRKFS